MQTPRQRQPQSSAQGTRVQAALGPHLLLRLMLAPAAEDPCRNQQRPVVTKTSRSGVHKAASSTSSNIHILRVSAHREKGTSSATEESLTVSNTWTWRCSRCWIGTISSDQAHMPAGKFPHPFRSEPVDSQHQSSIVIGTVHICAKLVVFVCSCPGAAEKMVYSSQ